MLSFIEHSAFQKARSLGWDKKTAEHARDIAKSYNQELARLRNASAIGDKRAASELQHMLLTAFNSIFICLLWAIRAEKAAGNDGDGIVKKSPTYDEVKTAAMMLDPRTNCGEKIIAWAEPKSSGNGWRPLCSFGPKRKALQKLVADIVRAKFPVYPIDFMAQRRGADMAADVIVKSINDDHPWVLVTDITNFYSTVRHGELSLFLEIPLAVVRNVLLIPSGAYLSLYTNHLVDIQGLEGAVRAGIPQGSITSVLVASLLYGRLLEHLAPAGRAFSFGDDCLITASNKTEAKAFEHALLGKLDAHPLGPFSAKKSEVRHIEEGFDFLKYRFKLNRFSDQIELSPTNLAFRRLYANVSKLIDSGDEAGAYNKIAQYRSNWVSAFPLWNKSEAADLLIDIQIDTLEWDAWLKKNPDKATPIAKIL